MTASYLTNAPPPERPRLRPGELVQIEVPWTVELPSPHRSGVLCDHFALEQCTILCETIEQSRGSGERRSCRLVDIFGALWFAEIYPDRVDRGARLQWFLQGQGRKAK
jgi:hypothetical protein